MSSLDTRKFALELAVRIVLVGHWKDAGERGETATVLADYFANYLEPPPKRIAQRAAKKAKAA